MSSFLKYLNWISGGVQLIQSAHRRVVYRNLIEFGIHLKRSLLYHGTLLNSILSSWFVARCFKPSRIFPLCGNLTDSYKSQIKHSVNAKQTPDKLERSFTRRCSVLTDRRRGLLSSHVALRERKENSCERNGREQENVREFKLSRNWKRTRALAKGQFSFS